MKTITTLCVWFIYSASLFVIAQVKQAKIGNNPYNINSSAAFEVESTDKGFLPPRMNYYQRTQITSPVAGLIIWCSNCGQFGEMQVFNGGVWTNINGEIAALPINLNIGDPYQGGLVAYILQPEDFGYDANTQHGLIVASIDQSIGIMFGDEVFIQTTSLALGTGFANTNAIIAGYGAINSNYAAGLARLYNGGGYSDWYLPSRNELDKIRVNKLVLGFTSDWYWSSSESNLTDAWLVNFANLQRGTDWKISNGYVRAVRSF